MMSCKNNHNILESVISLAGIRNYATCVCSNVPGGNVPATILQTSSILNLTTPMQCFIIYDGIRRLNAMFKYKNITEIHQQTFDLSLRHRQ